MGMIAQGTAWLSGPGSAWVATLAGSAAGTTAIAPRHRATYDRLVDALNRLPRPLMALGTLALIGAAMGAPDWFAARMDALAAMPEGLWWVIGAVISLFFGSRLQTQGQAFRRELVERVAAAPADAVPEPPKTARSPAVAMTETDAALTLRVAEPTDNAALSDWSRTQA